MRQSDRKHLESIVGIDYEVLDKKSLLLIIKEYEQYFNTNSKKYGYLTKFIRAFKK